VGQVAGAPTGLPAAEVVAVEEEPMPFDLEDPLAPPVTLDLPIDARIPPSISKTRRCACSYTGVCGYHASRDA